jgi:OmpA-OmpF porin, OOP family
MKESQTKTPSIMNRNLLLFFFVLPLLLRSQNLVLNPSFEELKEPHKIQPCDYIRDSRHFTHAVQDWTSFFDRTTDLIIRDSSMTDCPYPQPRSGQHYAGIIAFLPRQDTGKDFDYHEYLQGSLTRALVPGRRYKVSFWVYQSDSVAVAHLRSIYGNKVLVYPLAVNNIGICLLTQPINPNQDFRQQVEWLNLNPVFEAKEILRNSKDGWRLVTGRFTATEQSRYFLLGNFREDANTSFYSRHDLSKLPDLNSNARRNALQPTMRIAYYGIDDVSIEEDTLGVDMARTLEAEGRYVFKGVYFSSGSHDIQPESFDELDALAVYLREYPEKNVEIAGHTDNVGGDEPNRLLSERRARAVRLFLTEQGVDENRLTHKGYGRTKPVAGNDTAAGRSKNRRVEVVLR